MDTKTIAIVGGGITGLSAAFYLQQMIRNNGLNYKMKLIEASPRLGGKINTLKRDGYTIERGPDSLLSRKESIMKLIDELDLTDEIIHNDTGQSYILINNKLH